MDKSKKLHEIMVSVFMILFSGYLLFIAYHTKSVSTLNMMDAMDFPKAILFCLLGLNLYILIRSLTTWKKVMVLSKETFQKTDPRVWKTIMLIVVYALAWRYISFSLGTWAYICVQAKLLNCSLKWRNAVLIGLFCTALMVLVFKVLFNIPLPETLFASFGIYF